MKKLGTFRNMTVIIKLISGTDMLSIYIYRTVDVHINKLLYLIYANIQLTYYRVQLNT